jgi:RHS repeat-associated protein
MYSYNLNGQLIEAINQNSRVKLIRDKTGRVEKEDQDGYTVQSSYNDLGFRQNIKSSLGANIILQHNIAGFVSQVDASQQNAQWQATIQYNSLGQEVERTMGTVSSGFSYDFAGRVKEQTTQAMSRLRRHKQYEWGINDKLHRIQDILNRTTTSFEYDQFDNLVQSMGSHLETENYFRDDVGNIFKTREKKDRTYSAGGKLLSTKENKYHYDDEGNLIKKQTPAGDWLYEWAGNGMLRKLTRPDVKQVSFEYDALGRRTAKIFSPASRPGREPAGIITRWVWDGNTPLHEWRYDIKDRPKTVVDEFGMLAKDREEPIDGLITWIFDEGTFKPAAKIEDGETYSIINDYLGTPCEAYNEEGEKVWDAELNSSGKIRKLTGQSTFIPFRYQGQYEDEETGLYYNRFRYYSAEEGIYVSQDPIRLSGGNPTFYSYVKDSNAWVDELGMDCSKDALKLRANMLAAGHTEPGFDNAAHHIVMSNSRDKRMQDVRKKMENFGIDINSPENGIFLPKNSATKLASGSNLPAHSKIHTNAYKQNVYDNLINTKSPEEFLENLAKIKSGL